MRYIVGIDPSSGARSSIGFSLIDMEGKEIVYYNDFQSPKTEDLRVRIKAICKFLMEEFKKIEAREIEYAIGIEQTVMLGKGGESLNRAIGAMMLVSPINRPLFHISNMQMKVVAGGSGKADKKDIAENLKNYFPNSDALFNLTASGRWDIIDSIGIGVATYEKHYKKPEGSPALKSSKTNKKSRSSSK